MWRGRKWGQGWQIRVPLSPCLFGYIVGGSLTVVVKHPKLNEMWTLLRMGTPMASFRRESFPPSNLLLQPIDTQLQGRFLQRKPGKWTILQRLLQAHVCSSRGSRLRNLPTWRWIEAALLNWPTILAREMTTTYSTNDRTSCCIAHLQNRVILRAILLPL